MSSQQTVRVGNREMTVDEAMKLVIKGPNGLDQLAEDMSANMVPMRSKQGIFKPKKLVMACALAWGYTLPPALVVQFNHRGMRHTQPVPLGA